ncbi:aldehyde ferredoxin oxidoreductase family protein [Syntrophomonas palmitatica]|uniref:aldehyde ferredoxin oxidoreductase family protein n=1 Tax=Syntrophomonas palmitatica TaxID=402877 RepID=UPI0006D1F30F|nr:aldehyde ferredoxin oxidoreductase family protein [Syntrophomonas palmitatica]
MFGYAGKLLEIDLGEGKISTRELQPEMARLYLGGIGFNARIIYDEVSPGADPLGKQNVLVFGVGSLVGSPFPTAARTEVSAKSPLTGGFGTSNSGAFWGTRLKNAGYDAVIIKGKAKQPVYILINNDKVEIKDAVKLWGKDAWESIDLLKSWHYGAEVALIGPAGEKQVRFASIENGYYDGWGRTGLGAVMGSKNLKAIVVRGNRGLIPADAPGLLKVTRQAQDIIKSAGSYIPFSTYGTMNATIPYGSFNAVSTHNFSRETLPDWKEKAGRQIVDRYGSRHIACQSCIIACGHLAEVNEGKYAGLKVKALEITPTVSFSGNMGLSTEAAIKAAEMCQRFGIDMVSIGSTVAFAMELYKQGIIKHEDLGYELCFGDEEAAFALMKDIVERRGMGDILAEGVKIASERIKGAEPYAMHLKGLEIPMIDPRGRWSTWTLGMLTNIRGGDHLRCRNPVENLRYNENDEGLRQERFGYKGPMYDKLDMPSELKARCIDLENDTVNIARMSCWAEDLINLFNSAGVCIRPPVMEKLGPTVLAEAHRVFNGIDVTAEELMQAAARSWNLMKLFNLREGEQAGDSKFPGRFYRETIAGRKLDEQKVQDVVQEYYEARGWDYEGRPLPETLKELGLENI